MIETPFVSHFILGDCSNIIFFYSSKGLNNGSKYNFLKFISVYYSKEKLIRSITKKTNKRKNIRNKRQMDGPLYHVLKFALENVKDQAHH